jgi:regulator of protease activity HflC (stomatin/prohibitin superfamily)
LSGKTAVSICGVIFFILLLAAAVLAVLPGGRFTLPGEAAAVLRVKEFAREVNYNYQHPERIYPYLTMEYRAAMDVEAFCRAFLKERSYPYLTPFFINYESIELSADKKNGIAVFSQAARLPGMTYRLPFIYERGNYYVIAFQDFPDGSYLKKFGRL